MPAAVGRPPAQAPLLEQKPDVDQRAGDERQQQRRDQRRGAEAVTGPGTGSNDPGDHPGVAESAPGQDGRRPRGRLPPTWGAMQNGHRDRSAGRSWGRQRQADVVGGKDQHRVQPRIPDRPVVAAGVDRVGDLGAGRPQPRRHRQQLRTRLVLPPDEHRDAQPVATNCPRDPSEERQRTVVGERGPAGVGEHAAAGLGEVARPDLDRCEVREMVQRDIDRAIGTGGEPADHPVDAIGQRREMAVDVVHDIEHVALVAARCCVGPLGVGVDTAADPAVGEDEDHRPGLPGAEQVVEPHVEIGDRHEHMRLAGHAVQQVVDGVALGRRIARRQVDHVVRAAVQRLGTEVDAEQAAGAGPGELHDAREAAVQVVVLAVRVGADGTHQQHREGGQGGGAPGDPVAHPATSARTSRRAAGSRR